jgi:precorrin-4 methylase
MKISEKDSTNRSHEGLPLAVNFSEAQKRGRFFVISIGPAGPPTATLQALETMKQVHAVVASPDQVELFSEFIGDTPVLFDPWKGLFDFQGKRMRYLDEEEMPLFERERERIRKVRVRKIRETLQEGKDVGLFEMGDPFLLSPWSLYTEMLEEQDVVLIPGMGCYSAAMAALSRSIIPSQNIRYLLQASPYSLMGEELEDIDLLKDLAGHASAMVLYLALLHTSRVFTSLKKVLPLDVPCAVIFWAGYPDREKVVRGTLGDMEERLRNEDEDFMGLLMVGRHLEGDADPG